MDSASAMRVATRRSPPRMRPRRGHERDGEVRAAFKAVGFGVPLARESRVSDQIRDALEAILTRPHSRGTTLSEADHVLGCGSRWPRTFEPIRWEERA